MHIQSTHTRSRRALSLLEVLVSVGILSILGVGALLTMIYTERQTRNAIDDMIVLELLNRQTELVRSAEFYEQLGDASFAPSGTGSLDAVTPDPSFTRARTFQYDPDPTYGQANAPTVQISYEWYGFGDVTGSTGTSIQFSNTGWPSDVDFTGHRVLLRPDATITAAAIADITNHNGGTFTCNSGINGWGTNSFEFTVPAGMAFEVDGGKWVRITITWAPDFSTVNNPTRTYSRDVFIPWRRDIL